MSAFNHFSITIMNSELPNHYLQPRPAFLALDSYLQFLTIEFLILSHYNSIYSQIILLSSPYPTNPLLLHYLSYPTYSYNQDSWEPS